MSKSFASKPLKMNALPPFLGRPTHVFRIKVLPPVERAQVAKFVLESDDSWIPEEFKDVMNDAAAGRLVDMETALQETPPPRLQ